MADGVYGLLLDDEIVEQLENQPIQPTQVDVEHLAKDPRRVTIYCGGCGAPATFVLRGAKRVVGACELSSCMKQGIEQLERFAHLAKSKQWDIISKHDVVDNPYRSPPKKPVRQEIIEFQQAEGLTADGILGPRTSERLRAVGRAGMIPVWIERLKEED